MKLLSIFIGRASQEIFKKIKKSTRGVHFTILPASPCAADFYETRHTRLTHRRNHVCQIFSRSVQGLRSSDTPKIAISHLFIYCCVALTTVWHCRATLWSLSGAISSIASHLKYSTASQIKAKAWAFAFIWDAVLPESDKYQMSAEDRQHQPQTAVEYFLKINNRCYPPLKFWKLTLFGHMWDTWITWQPTVNKKLSWCWQRARRV